MTPRKRLIELERQGDTLILSLRADLREGKFWEIEEEAPNILDTFKDPTVKNLVLDFAGTEAFGSSALGFFLRLWKRVKGRNGHMVLCNLSEAEEEVLEITRLNSLWPAYSSRQEALWAVREGPG